MMTEEEMAEFIRAETERLEKILELVRESETTDETDLQEKQDATE